MSDKKNHVYSYVWLCPDCYSISETPFCPECRRKLDFIKNTFLLRTNFARRGKYRNIIYI